MKGNCEIFNKNKCLGCEALARDDLDILKHKCEIYRDGMKEEKNGKR